MPIILIVFFLVISNAPPTLSDTSLSSHGIAMHGDLKYDENFTHFEYVNPNAPKGGIVRLGARGTYDSFNGFIIKGNAAAGLGLIYDNLMHGSSDEIALMKMPKHPHKSSYNLIETKLSML